MLSPTIVFEKSHSKVYMECWNIIEFYQYAFWDFCVHMKCFDLFLHCSTAEAGFEPITLQSFNRTANHPISYAVFLITFFDNYIGFVKLKTTEKEANYCPIFLSADEGQRPRNYSISLYFYYFFNIFIFSFFLLFSITISIYRSIIHVYLPRPTYLHLPIYVYLPTSTYLPTCNYQPTYTNL